MLWQDMNRHARVAIIHQVWDKDCSAATMAEVISRQTNSTVSRHSVLGVYQRNPQLQITHPLGGGGVSGRRQLRDGQGNKLPRASKPKYQAKLTRKARTPAQPTGDQAPVAPPKLVIAPHNIEFDQASRHIPLEQVGPNQCHWPVNDPEPGTPYLFCGHGTEDSQRYCPHHHKRSIR